MCCNSLFILWNSPTYRFPNFSVLGILRHRRSTSSLSQRVQLRNVGEIRSRAVGHRQEELRSPTGHDRQGFEASQSHLPANGRVRPLRPTRVLVGTAKEAHLLDVYCTVRFVYQLTGDLKSPYDGSQWVDVHCSVVCRSERVKQMGS